MRKKTGCTPMARTRGASEFDDEMDATMTKDGHSTDACASYESSDHDHWEDEPQVHYRRILSMLRDPDGLARMLTDMCCASEISEPTTHELRPNSTTLSGTNPAQKQSSDPTLRRSITKDGIKVIEVPQRKKSGKVRSQTAPRQRSEDDNFLNLTGFNMNSPRTTSSTRSDGKDRQRGSRQKVRGWFPKGSESERRKTRSGSRARSIHEGIGNGDLPPRPRHMRAKSNASTRKSYRL